MKKISEIKVSFKTLLFWAFLIIVSFLLWLYVLEPTSINITIHEYKFQVAEGVYEEDIAKSLAEEVSKIVGKPVIFQTAVYVPEMVPPDPARAIASFTVSNYPTALRYKKAILSSQEIDRQARIKVSIKSPIMHWLSRAKYWFKYG
ncbi:MAG: hypothetical protein HY396_01620 [Candidatus Doudnabacteria bacterium]|nr:hypothetical protein [Candidatus Doudnabacteria bacterium]